MKRKLASKEKMKLNCDLYLTQQENNDPMLNLNRLWNIPDEEKYENIYPPFNHSGEICLVERQTPIEDSEKIYDIYHTAFIWWKDDLMNKLCRMISFILDEKAIIEGKDGNNFSQCSNGTILGEYMTACCSSQSLANLSRNLLFPQFRNIMFSKPKTIIKKYSNMIDWKEGFCPIKNKNKLWNYLSASYNEGKHQRPQIKNYKRNGTIMHQDVALRIVGDLLVKLGLSFLDVFIPGRIVSARLPFLASTPDICVSFNKFYFKSLYSEYISNQVLSEKNKLYVPHIWAEVKTVQKESAIIKKKQLIKLFSLIAKLSICIQSDLKQKKMSVSDILGIDEWHDILCNPEHNLNYDDLLNMCKAEATDILSKTFNKAGWKQSSKNQKSKKETIDTLFKRTINLLDESVINKYQDKSISQHKVKHLFSSHMDMLNTISISPLIATGHAWILVYGKQGLSDKCLLSMSLDTAPFLLNPCGTFYTQILEQACCVQYMNGKASFLFVAITKHESKTVNNEVDINHPCLAYIYEVIIPDCVRRQYEKQCLHKAHEYFGFNTEIINAGQKVIDNLVWSDDDFNKSIPSINLSTYTSGTK